ncbi:MAG: hypothetical protein SGJ21_03525 [Alphaproteobacteria bacterium]|nr:hypothetical protein [Alphaproteobacteria bacterium]
MRLLLASTAIAAAMGFSTAFAQVTIAPASSPPTVETPMPDVDGDAEGKLIVDGVSPADALSAIDTSKLVDNPPATPAPATATIEAELADDAAVNAEADVEADVEVAADETSPPASAVAADSTSSNDVQIASETTVDAEAETEIAATPEASAALDKMASIEVELPAEVQAVAMNDRYTTADLVAAQLAALRNAPMPAEEPVSSEPGAPVFDRSGEPGAWSQSAGAPGQSETSDATDAPAPSDEL